MSYKPNNRAAKQRASNTPNTKFTTDLNASQRPDGSSQWQRRYDYYRNLAQQVGDTDRVTRENYWQHAEHFCRLMNGSATQLA